MSSTSETTQMSNVQNDTPDIKTFQHHVLDSPLHDEKKFDWKKNSIPKSKKQMSSTDQMNQMSDVADVADVANVTDKIVPGVVLGTPTPYKLTQAHMWVKVCQPFYKHVLPDVDSVNWDDQQEKEKWREMSDMVDVLTGMLEANLTPFNTFDEIWEASKHLFNEKGFVMTLDDGLFVTKTKKQDVEHTWNGGDFLAHTFDPDLAVSAFVPLDRQQHVFEFAKSHNLLGKDSKSILMTSMKAQKLTGRNAEVMEAAARVKKRKAKEEEQRQMRIQEDEARMLREYNERMEQDRKMRAATANRHTRPYTTPKCGGGCGRTDAEIKAGEAAARAEKAEKAQKARDAYEAQVRADMEKVKMRWR